MAGMDAAGLARSSAAGARRWFSTDGVRGIVDEALTEELVEQIGRAATLWAARGRVLVGRELGADVILQAVNRARVQRVLHKKMSANTLRAEIEAALNETLLERDARDCLRAAANK